MAFSTHEFKLDLTPGASRPVLYASQGDIGRPFMARCYWNGATWNADAYTVNIRGRKPDETVFDYTATVDGSTVTFETTEQMTIISGPVECELVFSNDGDVIASANFVLMVEESPYDPDALSESVITGIVDLIEDTIGGDVRDEVQAELEAHPEWTTTVQAGAITKAKINTAFLPEIENAYVTPEQFGAVGDGVTDDTQAWQSAVDSGYNVKARNRQYKCGQINVTKNITIDCNGAAFVCTSEYLFKPSGTVVDTLTGETDYTANQENYRISNSSYSNYSGYAMLQGTNNWNPLRTYYLGGMVGFFANGIFADRVPIDVTGVSILIINPITCNIYNISGVVFNNTHDGKIIYCSYGVNCNFENIVMKTECYHIVALYRCYSCDCIHIDGALPLYNGTATNTYPVACLDTCYSTTKDSTIYNPFWHAWTTGQQYLCVGNVVDNCVMTCDNSHAIEDHENAIGTVVRNTTASQIGLAQGGIVENVKITSTNDANSNCELQFSGSPVEDLAVYTAKNITFEPSDDCQSVGVCLRDYTQTTGNTVYYKSVDIVDTFYNNKNVISHASLYVYTSPPAGIDEIIIKNITVDNTNMRCNLWDANVAKLNFDNANITIKNCKAEQPAGVTEKHIVVTLAKNANITIENSKLYWLTGNKAKTLTFFNVEVYGASIAPNAVLCNGVSLVCAGLNLRSCENVLLHNVLEGSAYYDKIWRLGLANDIYATRLLNSIDPVNTTFQTA